MKAQKRMVLWVLGIIMLVCVGEPAVGSSRVNTPLVAWLEPQGKIEKNMPVTIRVTYALDPIWDDPERDNTGSFSVGFIGAGDGARKTYPVMYERTSAFFDIMKEMFPDIPVQRLKETSLSYTGMFQVVIPDTSVSCLRLEMKCGKTTTILRYYFVEADDTIGFYGNHPIDPRILHKPAIVTTEKRAGDIDRDTLTEAQLDSTYDVLLDLKDPDHRSSAEKILGEIPEETKSDICPTCYALDISLRNLFKLADKGLKVEFFNPPPWSPEYRTPQVTPPQKNKQPDKDTEDRQSSVHGKSPSTAPYGLSLDSVSILTPNMNLPTDTLITFYIHINNTYNVPKFGIQTGFRIYSPNGASWGDAVGDTLPLGWGYMFDLGGFFINHYSADGYGADTIGFGGGAFNNGMPGDFDERSYMITIGPIDGSMDGKTICLDSSFFPPVGNWMWCDQESYITYPPWNGPWCFEIEKMNTITYSGYLYYLDPVPPDTNQMPMRRIKIEMRDDETIGDDLVGSTTTDNNGFFSFGPVENTDDYWGGNLDIFFRIYAENEAAYVTEDYNDDIYEINTPVQNDLPSGEYDTTIVAPADYSGSYFIADAALDCRDQWGDLTGDNLPTVQIASAFTGALGSFYNDSLNYIGIQNGQFNVWYWPDVYDKSIIFEEYSHYVEYLHDFLDSSQGYLHQWWDTITVELGGTEGFAAFMAGVFQNDSMLINYGEDLLIYEWRNLENGELGYSNAPDYYTANNFGPKCEGAVAGIFWDIYDYADDDYGSLLPSYGPDPDGIGDSLSNGPLNILSVLLNRYVDGDHPDEIGEFWTAWFQAPSMGHDKAMRDIFYEHGIATCGDTDGDGLIGIADVVYLMNYIFKGGPAPDPLESGDVDSYSGINVGDAVYLINYMFKEGPPPCGIQ